MLEATVVCAVAEGFVFGVAATAQSYYCPTGQIVGVAVPVANFEVAFNLQ